MNLSNLLVISNIRFGGRYYSQRATKFQWLFTQNQLLGYRAVIGWTSAGIKYLRIPRMVVRYLKLNNHHVGLIVRAQLYKFNQDISLATWSPFMLAGDTMRVANEISIPSSNLSIAELSPLEGSTHPITIAAKCLR